MPYSVNEITEFDNTPFLENVTHELKTIHVPFIENIGQVQDDDIKYYAHTFAGSIFVSDDDITYLSNIENNTRWITKEVFLNGNVSPKGFEKSQTVVNYFKGNSDNWKSGIPTYDSINLGNVWPSIQVDLKAYGNNMEKIFTVFPGGDVSKIKTTFTGVSKLDVNTRGELVIYTEKGEAKFSKPIAYQIIDDQKFPINVSYDVNDLTYGFSVGSYDSRLPLVIDPLIASTFVGGGGFEEALYDIVLDSSGNVYITGETSSTDYPTVSGYDSSHNGDSDAFVSKLDSTLSSLLASTFIGGSMDDASNSIALDSSGNVYITGETISTDYPTVSGYDSSHNGSDDAFVSKLDSTLSSLLASTLIGGNSSDIAWDITLDNSTNVYITGDTYSTDYPTVSGYDSSHNGGYDAFVSKLDSTLSSLSASTFIGGIDFDESVAIALDSFDNVYITGLTNSTDYPTVSGYDSSHNGSDDAFVSKLDSTLSSLSASTFIGSSDDEQSFAIILDNARNVYITGYTNSTDYPTVSGYDSSHNGGSDVFVSYLDCDLSNTGSECTSPLVFLDSEVVASGGEFTVTLPENDAGSVNTVVIDLPPGVGATIIVSTTDEGTETDPDILFLDQVLDFDITSSTPSFTFQVSFTFTDEDLEAAGLSLDEVAIFRDENENGSFDESESLVTTITPSSAPGPYTAEADVPSNSKFAIGGVANAVAGIGAAGNFLGLIQDTCDESGFGQGESLRIYEISYDKCDANQITILADTTCGPMKIFVEEESNMNLAGMPSDQPYLNEQKRMIVLSSPITSDITEFSVIAKDKRDEFYQKINADQCSATKEYTFTTGYTSEQNSATSLLLPDWIKNNAKWWSNDEIDDQTFVNGVQYLVEHDIISVQKDIQTENINDTIPDWIKNNAKWWSNDEIDDQTFVNGIQHLVKVGIIKVDRKS